MLKLKTWECEEEGWKDENESDDNHDEDELPNPFKPNAVWYLGDAEASDEHA